MKATGMVRNIDSLGRIVIPIELRTRLGMDINKAVEIFTDEDMIILRRYEPADIFTGETEDLIDFDGKKISRKTIRAMAEQAGFKIND